MRAYYQSIQIGVKTVMDIYPRYNAGRIYGILSNFSRNQYEEENPLR
jgi:hypothetical protein